MPGAAAAGSDDFTWISGTQLRHNTDGEVFTAAYITKDPTTYVSVEQKSFGGGSWDDTSTNTEVSTGNPAMIFFGSSTRNCSNDYRVAARHSAPGNGGGAIDDKVLQITGNLVVVTNYQTATRAHYLTFDQKSGTDCHANNFDDPVGPRPITNSWQNFGGQWTDPIHIKLLGSNDVYTESSYNNGIMTLDGPTNGCGTSQLVVGTDPTSSYQSASSATWNIKAQISPNGQPLQCNNSTATIALTDKHTDIAITAQWPANTATIQDPATASIDIVHATASNIAGMPIQDKSFTGKSIDGSNTFTLAGSHGAVCSSDPKSIDTLVIANYQNAITATMTVYYVSGDHETCRSVTVPFVDLLNTFGNPTAPGGSGNPPSGDTCPVDASDETRWITCPSLNFLDKAALAVNSFIAGFLVFPVDQYMNGQTESVFAKFRDLGVALLVIAGLIMVVSQAADLEIFSAHTVRKTLPRIIIAAIGISLAWPLLKFSITFFNDLGNWVSQAIIDIAGGTTGGAGISGILFDSIATLIAGIATVSWLTSFTIGGILALLLVIILFLLVGLFVLLARQIVILLCVLTAPLAIAAYILPSTDKLWKFWKDTLLTALLMFPIIMAFLSAGAAMGHITGAVTTNPLFAVLSLFFYIVPYALIPAAAKFAGGTMGSLIRFAEGQRDKGTSGIRGYMQQERQWKKQQYIEGKRENAAWNVPGRIGTWFSRRAAMPGGFSRGFGDRSEWAEHQRKQTAELAEKMQQQDNNYAGGNDDLTKVAMHARSRQEFLTGLSDTQAGRNLRTLWGIGNLSDTYDAARAERSLSAFEASFGGVMGTNVMRAAAWKARIASNTGYTGDRQGLADITSDAAQFINEGILSRSDAVRIGKTTNQNRQDIAGVAWTEWFNGVDYALENNRRITSVDPNSIRDDDRRLNAMQTSVIEGNQLSKVLGGHTNGAAALAPVLSKRIQDAYANLAQARAQGMPQAEINRQERDLVHTLADAASVHDYLAASSPQIGNTFAYQTFGQTVAGDGSPTVENLLEQYRNSDWMLERRREWGAGGRGQVAGPVGGGQPPQARPQNVRQYNQQRAQNARNQRHGQRNGGPGAPPPNFGQQNQPPTPQGGVGSGFGGFPGQP